VLAVRRSCCFREGIGDLGASCGNQCQGFVPRLWHETWNQRPLHLQVWWPIKALLSGRPLETRTSVSEPLWGSSHSHPLGTSEGEEGPRDTLVALLESGSPSGPEGFFIGTPPHTLTSPAENSHHSAMCDALR